MKNCKNENCSQTNPQSLENFSNSARHKDGKLTECKSCIKKYRSSLNLTKPKFPCVFEDCCTPRAFASTGLCAGHQKQLNKGYELQPIIPGKQVRQNFRGHEKICNTCHQWLPVNSFGPAKGLSGGIDSICRRCRACLRYNMTALDYQRILKEQNAVCKICNKAPLSKPLYVDHDHSCCSGDTSCGKCVRGLICYGCNSGLGMFQDNLDTLEKALAYLKDYKYGSVLPDSQNNC